MQYSVSSTRGGGGGGLFLKALFCFLIVSISLVCIYINKVAHSKNFTLPICSYFSLMHGHETREGGTYVQVSTAGIRTLTQEFKNE